MTFLQQKMLTPTRHVEEISLLNTVLVLMDKGDINAAKLACVNRLIELERVSEPTLVDFRQGET
jgi:hypothetical protein